MWYLRSVHARLLGDSAGEHGVACLWVPAMVWRQFTLHLPAVWVRLSQIRLVWDREKTQGQMVHEKAQTALFHWSGCSHRDKWWFASGVLQRPIWRLAMVKPAGRVLTRLWVDGYRTQRPNLSEPEGQSGTRPMEKTPEDQNRLRDGPLGAENLRHTFLRNKRRRFPRW